MSSRWDGQPWLTAIIWTSALEDVCAVRPVDLAADAATQLVVRGAKVSASFTGVSDDHLTIAVDESDFRRSPGFLHRAMIVAPMQAIENV